MAYVLAWVRRSTWVQLGALLGPTGFWLTAFLIVPLVLIVVISLAHRGTYGNVVYTFSLENYARFFEPLYLNILGTTVYMAFLTVVICIIIGYPLAYYIALQSPGRKNLLLLLVVIPFWTSFLIRTYAWKIILGSQGLINTVLTSLGIVGEPLKLLFTPGAVLVGLVYGYLPFMVLPLYTSIEGLDHSLLEAAADLGASPTRTFLTVTLPLTMPGIMAGTILTFIPALGMFIIPDLLGGAKSVLVGNLIKNQFLMARNWPFGSAAAIILMFLALAMIFAYVRMVGKDWKGGLL